MELKFCFVKREKELDQLQESFKEEVLKQKKCISFLLRGRLGIGKTRLIQEFITMIKSDLSYTQFFSDIRPIEYDCKDLITEPYQPLIKIKEIIDDIEKRTKILKRFAYFVLSMLPFRDLVEDFFKLKDEITEGKPEEIIRKKEKATFKKYLQYLKKLSKRAPLIIFIQNIQMIDNYSLKLMQTLIENEKSFWGMIILEENETKKSNNNVKNTLERLIKSQKMKKLFLKPLQKGFEFEILEDSVCPQFFTTNEYEYIYTLSEGCPGILADYVNDWLRDDWIFQDQDKWGKISDFEDRITPPYQKMLDLLITFIEDGKISKKEQLIITKYAKDWNIDDEAINRMISIVSKSQEIGYDIEKRAHKGSFSIDAFVAHNKNMEKFILEYIPNIKPQNAEVLPREVKHPSLLVSKDIIICEDGVIIVNDFYKGETLQEYDKKEDEIRSRKVLNIAIQIAEGLEELHRNGFVHGYIRPQSIIVSEEGEFRLSALDALQLNLSESLKTEEFFNFLPYFSPEKLKNEDLDFRSDIFSFGIFLYEQLTGELPFKGADIQELKKSICYGSLSDFNEKTHPFPFEIWELLEKCLQKNPEDRYQNMKELLKKLKKAYNNISVIPQPPAKDKTIEEKEEITIGLPIYRKKKNLIPIVATILIVFALVLSKYVISTLTEIKENVIVIDEAKIVSKSNLENRISTGILEYLILDALLQSNDTKTFITKKEYDFLYGKEKILFSINKEKPELWVRINEEFINTRYKIDIFLKGHSEKSQKYSYEFYEPSILLTENIHTIAKNILNYVGEHKLEVTTFTQNWDAFEQFYFGEKAWNKLEGEKADTLFNNALDKDPDFVLAKLRLAQVNRFNGNYIKAQNIINEIRPELGKLSQLDSLRAEALDARLKGDINIEIGILSQIRERFPARKECAYEVAEAYLEKRDIENAIYYYKLALESDSDFALAHNHLAYCHTQKGEHDVALKHFRKYVELDSTANSFDSLGDGYMATGMLDSAAWAKNKGIQLDPETPYLYRTLSYINIRQGKLEEAEKNALLNIQKSDDNDSKARGYFLLAYIHYLKQEYSTALDYCLKEIELFDTMDIVTRDHDVHWLLGILYLKLNQSNKAEEELDKMIQIIEKHKITSDNYRRGIYKYMLHLKALFAAEHSNLKEIMNCINEFDGPIKYKIKDHESPFDLAYFNTVFAELFMEKNINRLDLAQERLDKALEYNRNYALAHYYLWKLNSKKDNDSKANEHLNIFKEIWKEADSDIKQIYGI